MTEVAITLAVLAVLLLIGRRYLGFEAQAPAEYTALEPRADLRTHLNGPIDCEGVIYGPTGRVASRFVARMQGRWTNRQGVLTEDFTYAGGGSQRREWTIFPGDNGHFTATAPDIIGTARGEVSGASIRMKYRIRLPEESGGHVLNVTDWLYVMENGTLMNRSVMRKFGLKVAELIATMRPARDTHTGAPAE